MWLPWRSRNQSASTNLPSKGIADESLRKIIRAGVGANTLAQLKEIAYQNSQIKHPAARLAAAEHEVQQSMNSPVSGPALHHQMEVETDQYMQWVRGSRCEKEGFWTKVGVHAAASAVVVIAAYVFLVVGGLIRQTKPASAVVQQANNTVADVVHALAPETQQEHQEPAHSASTPAPAKPGAHVAGN